MRSEQKNPRNLNYVLRCANILVQQLFWSLRFSGHSSFPVVPAFRSFQLSGRSSFPVVPAFRSFQLSGRSSFPVVPAFRSFLLYGRSSIPVVLANRSFQLTFRSSFSPVVVVTESNINFIRGKGQNYLSCITYCQKNHLLILLY